MRAFLMYLTVLSTCTLALRVYRQIVSGSRDKTIKLWNTLGECKYTIQEDVSFRHGDTIGFVRLRFILFRLTGGAARLAAKEQTRRYAVECMLSSCSV